MDYIIMGNAPTLGGHQYNTDLAPCLRYETFDDNKTTEE
jgi:hypothetical protein